MVNFASFIAVRAFCNVEDRIDNLPNPIQSVAAVNLSKHDDAALSMVDACTSGSLVGRFDSRSHRNDSSDPVVVIRK